jgi:uncharacterized protein (TIGR00299 family) protein
MKNMKRRILYIEPFSGVSGDMFAGVLLSLLEDRKIVFDALKSLSIHSHFSASLKSVVKHGIKAEKFNVELTSHTGNQHGRTLPEIIDVINSGKKISAEARELAIRIFKRLAEVEAKIHSSEIEKIHFHEVGAIDSIVDIVTSSIAFCLIKPDVVISRPVALGNGEINSAHGILPVPAPATAELLKNIPVDYTNVESELTTPTGAAIIAEIVNQWESVVSGKMTLCGYGAGTKDLPGRPNVLRVSLLEQDVDSFSVDTVAIIETNIDDMPGEFLSHIGPGLFDKGCFDYAIIPATMKKNRQGFILQVICSLEKLDAISEYILKNTSTIGIRYRIEQRKVLSRKSIKVDTSCGEVRVKLALDKNSVLLKFKPELDDVSEIAKKYNLGFQQIYSAILVEISDKLKIGTKPSA